MSLTKPQRALLEEICSNPHTIFSGSQLALAHKLQAEGLVEYLPNSQRRSFRPTPFGLAACGKDLPQDLKDKIAAEIKMLLHASRDCMRNRKEYDSTKYRFVAHDGYYAEAFGMLRGLVVMGFGQYGAVNVPGNVNFWFEELQEEVLKEENYGGSNECDWCLQRYGKDGAGRKR